MMTALTANEFNRIDSMTEAEFEKLSQELKDEFWRAHVLLNTPCDFFCPDYEGEEKFLSPTRVFQSEVTMGESRMKLSQTPEDEDKDCPF